MKISSCIPVIIFCLFSACSTAQETRIKKGKITPPKKETKKLVPIIERVNIQQDSAKSEQIIDNRWVAVGIKNNYAIQKDYTLTFNKKPSFRFELKEKDNTLSGYKKGTSKGRAELSFCYATNSDFQGYSDEFYETAQKKKTVYHHGKGSCSQGASREYRFSIFIPSSLRNDVSTIFAQWHGMPDRTLVRTPEGEIKKLTDEEFLKLYNNSIIKKNIAYHKVPKYKNGKMQKDVNGNIIYKAGNPNGWLIEQGGYPPLAFGFSSGYFYIKANSDRKWLTDKTDRCNANVERLGTMESISSMYKKSTIVYKEPFVDFPKNKWVTFTIQIDWTTYGKEAQTILKPGKLDVKMSYEKNQKSISKHVVKNEQLLIGRNDDDGYYFKFGIYRIGDSKIPVTYNLTGYSEK